MIVFLYYKYKNMIIILLEEQLFLLKHNRCLRFTKLFYRVIHLISK